MQITGQTQTTPTSEVMADLRAWQVKREYRVIHTGASVPGPHGFVYMHDAARPFAVLRDVGRREICVGRYSTITAAKAFIRNRANAAR